MFLLCCSRHRGWGRKSRMTSFAHRWKSFSEKWTDLDPINAKNGCQLVDYELDNPYIMELMDRMDGTRHKKWKVSKKEVGDLKFDTLYKFMLFCWSDSCYFYITFTYFIFCNLCEIFGWYIFLQSVPLFLSIYALLSDRVTL